MCCMERMKVDDMDDLFFWRHVIYEYVMCELFCCWFVVTNGMVRMMIIWDITMVVVEWFDEVFMQFYA